MPPFVSLVTPTYNRRRFIPSLIRIIELQTYPRDRMEWILLDDGQEEIGDLIEAARSRLPTVRYIREEDKMTLGEKRNRLNREAKGEIIIAFDDDDFYFPERVQHVVQKFNNSPSIQLAGSSEVFMYYSDIQEIYKLGPYSPNHATNGTMAFRKSYTLTHFYDETVTHAEEKSFLENYKNPMIQLDPMKVMLVMSHSDNTFDKTAMREDLKNPFIKKTSLKIKDFIKDADLRNFFTTA